MVRNTKKLIEEMRRGKINSRYEMYASNLEEILENSTDRAGAVINGFVFGYAQGMKATKSEMKKQAKAVVV